MSTLLHVIEHVEGNQLILYRKYLFIYLTIHSRHEQIKPGIEILFKSLLEVHSDNTEYINYVPVNAGSFWLIYWIFFFARLCILKFSKLKPLLSISITEYIDSVPIIY